MIYENMPLKNLEEVRVAGSSNNINVVVHIDTKMKTGAKITERYYAENGRLIKININDPKTAKNG